MSKTVEFFFDIASPYSYLAAIQLARNPVFQNTVWRPFLIGGVFKAAGNQMPAAVPAKGQYMLKDLERLFAHYGSQYRFPSIFPINSLATMRVLAALPDEKVKDAALMLFDAYWGRNLNVGDAAILAELFPEEVIAATQQDAVKEKLKQNTEEAVRRGAFGAPSIFVGEELYFGEDRLFLVEKALLGQ